MGAKVPGKLRIRRPTCKCDVCGRGFMSIQALRSHQACVHPKSKRVAYKPKIEVIARRKPVHAKKMVKPTIIKSKSAVNLPVEREMNSKMTEISIEEKSEETVRKTEFECPVCSKMFTVYFSAYRHIQKHHCVNIKGEAVSPNSSQLIKPTLIEYCLTCNAKLSSIELHTCSDSLQLDEKNTLTYTCLGCEQQFDSLHLFEVHVPGLHDDMAETLFFPDFSEFFMWQEHMEASTDIKYLVLTKKAKYQVYHCNYLTSDDNTSLFCPSSFIVQEFSKGLRVTFYKQHFGHLCDEYIMPNEFKKYAITSLMKDSERYNITDIHSDESDMYLQFKNLMENIVVDSAKININSLKVLLGKALEMTSVLNNYNEDDDNDALMTNRSMTDEQISDLLETPQRSKRKHDLVHGSGKKVKKDFIQEDETRATRNILLRANSKVSQKTELNVKQKNEPKVTQKVEPKVTRKPEPKHAQKVEPKITPKIEPNITKKVDINITGKVEPKLTWKIEPAIIHKVKAKVTHKDEPKVTSQVEHKVTSDSEPQNESVVTPEVTKDDMVLSTKEIKSYVNKRKMPHTIKSEENVTPNVSPKPTPVIQSPSSFNDSYKNFVDANFKLVADKVTTRSRGEGKKKAVVKTKIGQFKPSMSPKNKTEESIEITPKIKTSATFPKVKADLEYEVQERENDCNVLILKI